MKGALAFAAYNVQLQIFTNETDFTAGDPIPKRECDDNGNSELSEKSGDIDSTLPFSRLMGPPCTGL
jgi:hypothetical protein